jgi:succinate dehydrogenase / fumarate reductase membrane anchor subunit
MREQRLWTWHVLAGLVILVFLGLHMAIMHLDVIVSIFNPADPHPIAWANVMARAKMGFFTVSYVVLLGAALFHGLYGLRNILSELGPARGVKRALDVTLTVGGVGLFVFGAWAAWTAGVLARTL